MAIERKPTVRIKSSKRFRLQQELQQKDRLNEQWSTQYLIDEIYHSTMGVKAQFCMMNSKDDLKNHDRGVIRRVYEEQARYKVYRMAIFRPPPVFVIHLKDLDDKIKKELAERDKYEKDFVLRQAAERIFEQVNERFFLLSAKTFLKVKLER